MRRSKSRPPVRRGSRRRDRTPARRKSAGGHRDAVEVAVALVAPQPARPLRPLLEHVVHAREHDVAVGVLVEEGELARSLPGFHTSSASHHAIRSPVRRRHAGVAGRQRAPRAGADTWTPSSRLGDRGGAVGAAVVHHDHLDAGSWSWARIDSRHAARNRSPFEHRHDHRDGRSVGHSRLCGQPASVTSWTGSRRIRSARSVKASTERARVAVERGRRRRRPRRRADAAARRPVHEELVADEDVDAGRRPSRGGRVGVDREARRPGRAPTSSTVAPRPERQPRERGRAVAAVVGCR